MLDPRSPCRQLIPPLDAALDARAVEWPRRGPAFHASVAAMNAFTNALLGSLERDWNPDPARLELAAPVADRPTVICGAMKSGTTLLLELLDGHPDLLVFPGDSHMAASFAPPPGPGADPFPALARHWVPRFVNPTGQCPFWTFGHEPEPYASFLLYLRHHVATLPPVFSRSFRAVVLARCASDAAITRTPRSFVVKTPESEHRVAPMCAEFPAARFIHVLRHPLAVAAALKRLYAQREWKYDAETIATTIRGGMLAALANQQALGPERYLIVRYEDLVADPRARMERIAAFLDIRFQPTLLAPTVAESPALSNSMFPERRARGQVVAEPAQAFIERITRELYAEERATIGATFQDGAFGYEMLA